MTTTSTYRVNGMTCEHCVRAVTQQITELDGVTAVTVDLAAGATSTVTVESDSALEDAAVAAAVNEAGYALA